MKLHGLRPRDGWRVFAGEVGVIVLGVLIALVAQQVAENWQWRQTVTRTEADLDDQLSAAIVQVAERNAVDPCLSQRLTELAAKVAASDGQWKGDPYVLPGEGSPSETIRYAIPPAYRAPGRPFPDDVWQQAKAAGVLAHMTPIDIENYTYAFSNVKNLAERTEGEGELSSELSFLSFDGTLDSSDRVRALSMISRLDGLNRKALRSAESLVGYAKSLGITLSAANEKELFEYLDTQQKFRGSCVDQEAALKLIAPIRLRGASRTQ